MAKFSLCVFTITVLLGGTTASYACMIAATVRVYPEYFLIDPLMACWNIETKFNRTRHELKECFGFEVDFSEFESLGYEICDPNSDFRQKVERQTFCLSPYILRSSDCLSNSKQSSNQLTWKFLRSQESWKSQEVYDACQSYSEYVSKCSADKVREPCGAEGFEVYRRIKKVSEPFLTGACLSIAKQAIEEKDFGEDEVEQKDVETSLAESEWNVSFSPAQEHPALTWCILVGLLFAAKWW